jgi:hypothetical protein
MFRYTLYFWCPPQLTPEQEIEIGRQIVLEGREVFLKRAPYLSEEDRRRIEAAKQMAPWQRVLAGITLTVMVIGALMVAWLPLLMVGVPIFLYSGGSLWHARSRYHRWVDEMIAKYAESTTRRTRRDQRDGRDRALQLAAADRQRIIQDYGALIERNPPLPTRVEDVCVLPHPKTAILDALTCEIIIGHPKQVNDALRVAATGLAQYQRGVGLVALEMIGTKNQDRFKKFDKLVQDDLRLINSLIAAMDIDRYKSTPNRS